MTDVKTADSVAAPKERFIPASETRFETSTEYREPRTSYVPEADTPVEHILRPAYWANIKALKPGADILVTREDGAWQAVLYVDRVGQGFASVLMKHFYDLNALRGEAAKLPAAQDDFQVEWKGPVHKHRIVRLSDKRVLKEGISTMDEANQWLRDYRRTLAA